MKNNKKWIIGLLAAVCIVLVIGTAVFASGTAKKVFTGSNKASADTEDYIKEEEAKKIALEHAGLTESNVSGLTVKLDYDDGQTEYEVEFFVDRMEYNYEINAFTGEIISYDQEIDD